MSGPTPTLADVARYAGVSLATASRVLGGSSYPVSPARAELVLEAARALDYVPNAHARALARAATGTVGLLVHDISDPYFAEIARGVLQVASEHERLVMICNTFRDPERELEYMAALRAQRVDAILLAGSGFRDPEIEARSARESRAFVTQGGRVATIGRHEVVAHAVLPDNHGGARSCVEHLLDLGHTEVGIIAGPASLTTVEDRLAGAVHAFADAGVHLPDDAVQYGEFDRQGGRDSAARLLDARPTITAIMALNDTMAVGAVAELRSRQLVVPDDVSVVGFDDIPLAVDVHPALTTVRVPMEEMGAAAMRLALEEPGDAVVNQVMETELVQRASTGPPTTG